MAAIALQTGRLSLSLAKATRQTPAPRLSTCPATRHHPAQDAVFSNFTTPGGFPSAKSLLRPANRRGSRLLTRSAAADMPAAADADYNLTPVLTAVAVACMGAFAFGYHLGVVNGPLDFIAATLGFGGDKTMQGMVVSSTLAGAAIGSLTGGGLADTFGRTRSFLLAGIPMLLGPIVAATANTFNALVAGRFLAGLAIGLSSALVPLYISEIAPTSIRGTLGSLNQLMICIGILVALVVNVMVPVTDWRTMFWIATVPAVILAGGMLVAPESPGWLVSQGRREEAEKVAKKLWGPDGSLQLTATKGVPGADQQQGGWGDLLSPAFRKSVLLGCALFAFQQFSGINALVYFSSSVFKQAGIESGTLASAAVGVVNVGGTLLATSMIESAGRKQLLTRSYAGMALAMLTMAAGFGLEALKGVSGTIALVGTLFYILSFAIGAGPVTGLIIPELNDARIRGKAVSAAFVTHWVANVVIGQSFIGWVDKFGLSAVYALFGAVSLVGMLYISSAVPETKGKSFEQIQAEMGALDV